MKKLILSFSILALFIQVNAQTTSKIPFDLLNKSEKMINKPGIVELPVILNKTNPYVAPKPAKDLGYPIGSTWYDLQSNAGSSSRIMLKKDWSIPVVWTYSPYSATGFPDKGTGFNRSTDVGYNWDPEPTQRIEPYITAWPNIASLSDGTEIIVSQTIDCTSLSVSTNNGLSWENSTFGASVKLSWTRMITSGNTIHVIGHTDTNTPYLGFEHGALVYLKSTDRGANWTTPILPTGLDTSNYSSHSSFNDSYSFAGKGDTIAILYGEGFRTPCLVKSTNGGETWSYREIFHLPPSVKKFNTEGLNIFDINGDSQQDNIYGNDGSNFLAIDKNGKVYAFFGRMKYSDNGTGAGYNYFPYTDGLYYWNEDMGTINYQYKWTMIGSVNTYEAIPDTVNFPIITSVLDINNNGVIELPDNGSNIPFGPYYCSLSSQPCAFIDRYGTIYLAYSSIVEGTEGIVGSEHRAFRNIWAMHKFQFTGNNFDWPIPVRVASDDFTEEVYPCVSRLCYCLGEDLYSPMYYQGDALPGISQIPPTANPHPPTENFIYFTNYYHMNGCYSGINENKNSKSDFIILPNPAHNLISIALQNFPKPDNLNLSICNLQGQPILQQPLTNDNTQIDISQLVPGIYIAKIQTDSETLVKKFIKE